MRPRSWLLPVALLAAGFGCIPRASANAELGIWSGAGAETTVLLSGGSAGLCAGLEAADAGNGWALCAEVVLEGPAHATLVRELGPSGAVDLGPVLQAGPASLALVLSAADPRTPPAFKPQASYQLHDDLELAAELTLPLSAPELSSAAAAVWLQLPLGRSADLRCGAGRELRIRHAGPYEAAPELLALCTATLIAE